MVASRVVVTGKVQGVYFRATCRDQALRYDVVGWVHNLGDGSVEAWFEGQPEAVAAMVEWCHTGPPNADVTDVQQFEEAVANYSTFEVRR